MKKYILRILLVYILFLSFSLNGLVQAMPDHLDSGTPPPPPPQEHQGMPISQEDLKTELDKLVHGGTITQEQAEQVLKQLSNHKSPPKPPQQENKSTNPPQHKSPLEELVNNGTITQEQAKSIEKAIFKGMPPQGNPEDVGKLAPTSTATYTQKGQQVIKSNQIYTASHKDESGIKVSDKGLLTLSDSAIITSGTSSSEENSNFYGLNAGILAEAGSTIHIKNSSITTSGSGANGIFATGNGSMVIVSDTKIRTTANSSRGLDATLTGTVNATNVDIATVGEHCAAVATDRGNGTIIVKKAILNTAGKGSPGIYSTGNIQVADAIVTATASEAAVIEGKNSIYLTNTTLSGAELCGVMLYQSFSGDAEVGTSSFTMNGGSLNAEKGPAFYVTNTQAKIELNDAAIIAPSGMLLQLSAGRWGTSGSNGGILTFTANHENLTGTIRCDEISSLIANLKENTTLTSTINTEKISASIILTLDASSTWNVTGDSYLSGLTDADTTLSNIHDNGFNIYYDGKLLMNKWLDNKTYQLRDGGKLTPKI